MADWQDIHITDLDERLSERIESGKAKWRFYFRLSAEAPAVWQQIFDHGRRSPRHTLMAESKSHR